MGHNLARASPLHRGSGSAIFFADDIVLISRTPEGLKELLSLVNRHCGLLRMKLAESKSKVMSGATDSWEEVLGTR